MKRFVLLAFLVLPTGAVAQDITFRSVFLTSDTSFTVSSLPGTAPDSVQDDDLLVAWLATYCLNPCTSPTITPPAGWTERVDDVVVNLAGGAYDARFTIWSKIAASEGSSWTWTASASVAYLLEIFAFDNPDTTAPFDVKSSNVPIMGSTSFPGTAITTAKTNELLLWIAGSTGTSTWTPPAGMTEIGTDPGDGRPGMAYVIQAAAGSTGTKTGTASASGDGGAWLLAFSSLSSTTPTTCAQSMALLGVGCR